MTAPRYWETGDGRVPDLLPRFADLRLLRDEQITMDEYRERFQAAMDERAARLDPESLYTVAGGGTLVRDGDTLCCACSREAAAKGECHRVWAAEALVRAGWRVVLDGQEVTP